MKIVTRFLYTLFLFISVSGFSQRGKDGSLTVATANRIVNEFTTLTANAAAGATSLTVLASGLNANARFAASLAPGDLIMIIQMQGVTILGQPDAFTPAISNPNDVTWGGITNYNNCGNYEFCQVATVPNATTIAIDCGLTKSYTASGRVQIVRVPRYTSLIINSPGSISTQAWNSTTGGIVAIEALSTVVINAGASITANALGFRGGALFSTGAHTQTVLVSCVSLDVGTNKGEGVAGYDTDYTPYGGKYCRGAGANAGGGANVWNTGGGGGGNAGNIAGWNGNGNPDNAVAGWTTAWNLEAAGFSANVSSGGGRGGYSFSSTSANATTVGPGTVGVGNAWGGYSRCNLGGWGGRPLDYSTGRLFLGGGGGAGDQDNNAGGTGGRAGGLIYILSYGTVSGTGTITSNGAAGGNSGVDGAGGGGAGGTIVINSVGAIAGVSASTNGGAGGNQVVGLVSECEGPGGGGGGGYIGISNGAIVRTATAGTNGTTNSNSLTEFPPNGATKGGVGLPTQTVTVIDTLTVGNVTICSGNTATLTATIVGTIPGTITWYNAATGGLVLGTGTTYTTPVLAVTTTYYVGICPGSFRKPVVVTVSPGVTASNAGANQTVCATSATLNGNVPLIGTGTWTLISGSGTITNPALQNTTVTGLGAGANVFQWTISNPSCAPSTSQVTITSNGNPTTSVAGPNQTVCGATATMAGNTPAVGTGQWALVSGAGTITTPSSPTTTITGLGAGANVFQWTISSLPCPSSSTQVTIASFAAPTVAASGPNQSICANSATMAGNAPATGTGLWTLVSGAGTITTPSSPTTTITGLGAGANVFQWAISNAPCPASTSQVTLTVTSGPTASVAGPNQTVCSANATMAGNTPVVGTGLWTLISGAGTITTPSSPTTTITGLGLGANVFQWTISSAPCTASTSQVTITRTTNPTIANAGPNQSVCTNSVTMAANTPVVGTGQWTLFIGTGTITSPTSPTTTITGLGVGANVFQWTISNAPCPASASQVTITYTSGPSTSVAGPNQSVCGNTATMAGNTPVVGTGLWTLISGAGIITTPTSPTTTITGLGAGANVFQWAISNAPCASSTSQATITTVASPTVASAGPNQTLCSATVTMAGNVPVTGTGLWTLVSGSGIITTPASSSTTITGMGAGANVFQWTISNSPCPSSSSQVTITNTGGPTTSVAGPNQSVCGNTATMAGNTPVVGTGTWSLISGSGTITTPTSPTTTITGLGSGANVFQWQIDNLPCAPSTSQVTITTVSSPTVATAGPNQTLCATSSSFAGNAAATGAGLWTLVSGSGVITSPGSETSAVTGLGVGANVFQWTISNAPCPASSSQVTITNTGGPTTSVAGPNQTVCGTNATMAGNVPAIGTGVWTLVSGTGIITTPTSPTTTLTGLGIGANIFQWEIDNLPCAPSTSQVTITSVTSPTVAVAGPNQTLCSTSATFAGNTATTGTGLWTLVSGSGTITTPISETSTVTALGTGANVFQWTISNAPCPASSSQVTITNTGGPTTSVAGPNQTVCGSNATMAGNTPVVGTGLWTLVSGSGTITTPTSPTTSITGLGTGANVFQWEIDNLPCAPSTSQVTITSVASPTVATAGPNQTICSTSGTFAGNTATIGTGLWTLVSGAGTITSPSSEISAVTGLGAGANVFQWTISNAPCPASSSQVTITNTGGPTTSVAGPNQTVCGSNATMAGNTPVVGTGLWTLVSGSGTITTPTSPTTAITGLGTGANVFQWEIDNLPCAPSTSQVTITSVAAPNVAAAGPNQTICSTSSIFAGNAVTIGTCLWTLVSGAGTITSPSSEFSAVTGLGAGANVFQWTISNAPCPASSSQVTLTNTGGPTTSVAGPNQTVCGANATMAGNVPVVGTGLWTLVSGTGTITTPASPTTTITGLGAGANVFQWEIDNLPCPASTSQVTITSVSAPTVAVAGPNQSICSTSSTFAGNAATIGTGLWTLISGTGTITAPSSEISAVTGLGAGANVFQWTISNAPCPSSSSQVTITNTGGPTTAVAGPNQTVCGSNATMAGNTPVVGTGLWTLVSGAGTITTPTSPTTAITGLGAGANVFQWEIDNLPCPASTSQVTITSSAAPTVSVAGPNQSICTTTATLAGNTAVVGTGLWTLISGSGTITTPSSPTSGVTGLGTGANVFEWTISNSPCPSSSSQVTITVNPAPTAAVAGPAQTICGTTATLAGNTATVGSGLWTLISGAGVITTPTSPTSGVTGLGTGANVFQWTISSAPCTPTTSQVTITANPIPVVTVPPVSICLGTVANFTANGATSYTWSAGATSTGVNTASATPVALGTISYTVTGTTNGCSSTALATVTVNSCTPPTANFLADDTLICNSGCVNFTDLSIGPPTNWSWIFPGGIPASANTSGPINVCYSAPGYYSVILIVSNSGGTDTIIRTNYIHIVATIPVTITGNLNINSCESIDLTAEPAGLSYFWGPNVSISCVTCQTATVSPTTTQQYYVTYQDVNGCVDSDTADVSVTAIYSYFMPTGFSPNADGINDTLLVHGRGIDYINLRIYDRVGEKVFETSDILQGWDGNLMGVPMNNNEFVYMLEVTYCNGQKVTEQGSVMLVK